MQYLCGWFDSSRVHKSVTERELLQLIRISYSGSMHSLGLCGEGSIPSILTTLVGEVETLQIANLLGKGSIPLQVSNVKTVML